MTYAQLWPAIQADILGAIQADSFLGTRQGVIVEPGDVASVISSKLARAVGAGLDGKDGVGFLVLPIEDAEDDNVSLPGGPLRLTLKIQWCENVIINRSTGGTGIPIRVYAAWTEKLLKLYTPVGLTQSLTPRRPVIAEFTDNANKNLRVGMVEFTAVEADFLPFQRVNRPQLNVSGATLTAINCWQISGVTTVSVTVPEADAIYYTLDGSHPYAGNGAAMPYAGAITLFEPCVLRVRAFAAGQAGSDTAAANFV